jgi:hypothetical protein
VEGQRIVHVAQISLGQPSPPSLSPTLDLVHPLDELVEFSVRVGRSRSENVTFAIALKSH